MSLLDSDNDESYGDEDTPTWTSHTEDPLFSGPPQKGKSKKSDRKAKAKQKENIVQEKTPKKSKGQSASKPVISWTPPGSPKTVHPEGKGKAGLAEGKGGKGVGGVGGAGQLQPSPNVKSNRKRYSQLGAESSSEGEGEDGFLLSNKPAIKTDEATSDSFPMLNPLDRPSNPFLVEPLLPGDSSLFSAQGPSLGPIQQGPGSMLSSLGTGASTLTPQQQQQQAWGTAPSLSARAFEPTVVQDLGIGSGTTNPLGLGGGVANPLLGMDSGPAVQTNPFLADTTADSAFTQPALNFPPPTSAPSLSTFSLHPDPQESTPPTAPPPEGVADWSISQEMCQKCMQQFQELEPVNGRLSGDKAKEFFIRSKLPSQELSAIWRLCGLEQDSALSQHHFCVAMKLVVMRRKGHAIPHSLPLSLKTTAPCDSPESSSITSQPVPPSSAWQNFLGSGHTSTSQTGKTSPPHPVAGMETKGPSSRSVSPRGPSPTYNTTSDKDELLVDLDGGQSSPTSTSPSNSQPQTRHLLLSPLRGGVTNPLDPLGLGLDQETGEGGVVLNPLDPLGLGLGEGDGDAEEDVKALVKVSSDSDSEGRRPVRPAPPKPRPHKPPPPKAGNKKKQSGGEGGVAGKVSPPSVLSPPAGDTVPMLTTSATTGTTRPPKPPRPTVFTSPKKSSYTNLLSSPLSDPEGSLSPPEAQSEPRLPLQDVTDSTGFQWSHLKNDHAPSSSADEASEKGHSRSTSLDLNKMLQAQSGGDVFGGLPSAIPPKPPPKRMGSPPAGGLLGVNEEGEVDEDTWAVISPASSRSSDLRPRSLSTGSMASTGGGASSGHGDDGVVMDTSTDALLLVHHKPPPPKAPKPKKVPMLPPGVKGKTTVTGGGGKPSDSATGGGAKANSSVVSALNQAVLQAGGNPKRPQPPSKPNKLAELYQGGGGEGVTRSRGSGAGNGSVGGAKDKLELQASIRSLKENNEALGDINRNLEEKLFQLMEERVRLARVLSSLTEGST